jgi:hypothetical protein
MSRGRHDSDCFNASALRFHDATIVRRIDSKLSIDRVIVGHTNAQMRNFLVHKTPEATRRHAQACGV